MTTIDPTTDQFPFHFQAWCRETLRKETAYATRAEADLAAKLWTEQFLDDTVRIADWAADSIQIWDGGIIVRSGTYADTTLVRIR